MSGRGAGGRLTGEGRVDRGVESEELKAVLELVLYLRFDKVWHCPLPRHLNTSSLKILYELVEDV